MRSFHINILFSAVILSGCSSSVTITVKDKDSAKPLQGILVERARPVSAIDKIFNPIGATYHPLRVAESNRTNKAGEVSLKRLDSGEIYWVYRDDARSLAVIVFGKEISLAPSVTNRSTGAKWGYAIWIEGNAIKQSAWPVKD